MDRIEFLIEAGENKKGTYVLYWMQQSQRVEYNHALYYAVQRANELKVPLLVAFVLTSYPEANERHYYFMLEGIREVEAELRKKNIEFVMKIGNPIDIISDLARNSLVLVSDKGYLKIQKKWRIEIADRVEVPMVEVESDLIVPIQKASNKEEYAAYTIRKKINRLLPDCLVPMNLLPSCKVSSETSKVSEKLDDIESIIKKLNIKSNVRKTHFFVGGYKEAKRRLESFIDKKLNKYHELKNNPSINYTSTLSPYLHFGQISSLEIALRVKESGKNPDAIASFIEELIVRRELAFNFCYYNENYDSYKGLKAQWIYDTLTAHKEDKRLYVYTRDQFENYESHDEVWNCCQKELVCTGDMHGYMRMYWGKKILEWSRSPEEAFDTAVYLNNKYALDGRDANSFTGIAWCFGKHDRPWFEREIFGKVRYMNDKGLKRKFKVEDYMAKVEALIKVGRK